MEKEFDFAAYAKSNPYQVPDGFFDNLPEQTLLLAKKRATAHKRFTLVTVASISAAASVALLVAWPYLTNPQPNTNGSMALNGNEPSTIQVVDTAKTEKTTIKPDTVKVAPKAVTSKKVSETEKAPTKATAPKKESLDDLLAELSLDELKQLADSGDDDYFIND
jgi:hypothetical protein